jgi:DtxR family transcriptional regulator, Mn-dependent transcriptional regulator
MEKEKIDEALEVIWGLTESTTNDTRGFGMAWEGRDADEVIGELRVRELITVTDDAIAFTEKGSAQARDVVRRHRLAERLFMDVFDLSNSSAEADACLVEHVLSAELTDSVCTFLGHPPLCPHGKPIPRGECCRKYSSEVKPLVVRLTDFETGKSGRIVFITPSDVSRIGRLSSIGVIPGTVVRLLQKSPSVVLQIDETTIAIDSDLAKEIFVKKV